MSLPFARPGLLAKFRRTHPPARATRLHRPTPLLLTTLLLSAALTARPALVSAATPAEEAEQLIERGKRLRAAGDDQGALPLFQRAYKLNPGPRTAAQLGVVEQALLLCADADDHLTEALKAPEDDPFLKKNRKILEESLSYVKKRVARVEVTGEPEGAEVLVNGRMVGKVPLNKPVKVNAGSVDVELRSPGYKPLMRTLMLTGGQYQPVVLRLERLSAAVARSGGAPPVDALRQQVDQDDGGDWRRWSVVGAVGGAALGLGVGAYGVLRHDSKVESFHSKGCAEKDGSGVDKTSGLPTPTCRQAFSAMGDARKLAIVGFGAAGALAVTALILHLTAPEARGSATEYAQRSTPVCVPDLVGRGLNCALRF